MGRYYGKSQRKRRAQAAAANSASSGSVRRGKRWVELFGGPAGHRNIEIEELSEHITIFRKDGELFTVTGRVDADEHRFAEFVGYYDLAGEPGPDQRVYVPTTW
jgi:hypothetical protein